MKFSQHLNPGNWDIEYYSNSIVLLSATTFKVRRRLNPAPSNGKFNTRILNRFYASKINSIYYEILFKLRNELDLSNAFLRFCHTSNIDLSRGIYQNDRYYYMVLDGKLSLGSKQTWRTKPVKDYGDSKPLFLFSDYGLNRPKYHIDYSNMDKKFDLTSILNVCAV